MKKVIIFLTIITAIFFINIKNEKYIIPEESIRFRIIPNSDTEEDIKLKSLVLESITDELTYINASNNIEDSRNRIVDMVHNIENDIGNVLVENKSDLSYSVKYGINYFPEKNYKDVIYPKGNYESLVITLGSGKGSNYWCVMFPPLCLIEETESKKIEYKFLITKIIDNFKY